MEKVNQTMKLKDDVTDLRVNESAQVNSINTADIQKLRKLSAFGIYPGTEVTVLQKFPAIVIKVGFTQIALDHDIAKQILINKDHPNP